MARYSPADVRQWLIDHGLITPSLQVLNPDGIYFNAVVLGVTGVEIDPALDQPLGTVDAFVASKGWAPLTGIPVTRSSDGQAVVPPVTPVAAPIVTVTTIDPPTVTRQPVNPAPATGGGTPRYVTAYPGPSANPLDEPTVGIDPGPEHQFSVGGLSRNTLLLGAAAAAFLLLRRR